MNRYTQQVLPILMGIAAVCLTVAAIVVIVGQVRADRRPEVTAATTFAREVGPALQQQLGRGMTEQLGQTYLGVSVQVQSNGGGLLVQSVMPNSPASKAGVEVGDVITALNGTKVTTADGLRQLLDQVGSGKTYTLTVTRSGKSQDLKVQQASVGGAAEQWFEGMLGNGSRGGTGGGGLMPRFGGPRRGPLGTPGPQT